MYLYQRWYMGSGNDSIEWDIIWDRKVKYQGHRY